ncbi:hypothetical protein C1T20_13580 [Paenibacillus polymyxa]|nr:hypothetical protein C1T20_13580 [Paenibacillus polymyxa]
MEQNDINDHQLAGEIHQILHKRMDKLGIAYGIVSEFSYNPEEPPSWIISIEDSEIVLTSAILFQYLKRHQNLKDALTHFMRDHFSYFN